MAPDWFRLGAAPGARDPVVSRWVGTVLAALVLTGIGALMVSPIEDLDLWWLLGGGRYMVETRSLPTADPFSATAAGAEWINHTWGFQLVLYGVHRLAGTTGLILLQALFAVGTFGLLFRFLRRDGVGTGWACLLIGLGAMATRGFWTPRPQVVTYLGLALFWCLLREFRTGRADRLNWLPPATAVWVNLHGGFIIGPALIALTFCAELAESLVPMRDPVPGRRRLGRLGLAAVLSMVAALANPFHARAVLFPFQVLEDRQARAFIMEWASPPFQHPQVLLVEGLILLTIVLLWRRPRPVGWGDLAVFVVFVHLALHAIRNLPLLVLVLIPILGSALAEVTDARASAGHEARVGWRPWSRQRPLAAGLVSLALLTLGGAAVSWLPLREFAPRLGVSDVFPAGAVAFLKGEGRGGNLFNDYGWGGYLIWHLYPSFRVSIDGRAAVYGPQRFADYLEVDEVRPRWRATLDRMRPQYALIRSRSALARVLRLAPDWEVVYEDHLAVVLAKRGSPRAG